MRSGGSNPSPSADDVWQRRRLCIAIWTIFFLSVFDMFMSAYWTYMGMADELNPLMGLSMSFGTEVFLVTKLVMSAFFALTLLYFIETSLRFRALVYPILAIYLVIGAYHGHAISSNL